MLAKRLIKSNDAGGGACTNTVDLYNPFPDGGGVALYQLNGDATDVSGNYNGTATSVTYGTGVFGQAGVFNGSSGKIELPTNVFSFSSFTLSGWVNVNANTDENTLFEIQDSNNYPNHTTIVISGGDVNNRSARFLFRNYLTNEFSYRPTGDSSTLGWRHYVMTYDGSTVNCYINGSIVQTGSFSLTNTIGSITGVRLGLSSGSRYLNGSIDQVRIFNTALDPLEVEALYTEELCICDGTVDTLDILGDGSCIALYPLDGNANDLSGNYSGTPTNVSYGVGEFDLAAAFSGTNYIEIPTLPDYRSGFAFSSWVLSDTTQYKFIITQKGTGGFANFAYRLSSGKISLLTGNGTSAYYINYTQPTALTNGWHHIVVTGTASSITIYVDGAFLTTQTGTAFS